MSQKGFHFKKYKWGIYYFDENPQEAYIYQIDFREPNETYFQLLTDAGWGYMDSYIERFHYFRMAADKSEGKGIYSDQESVKETQQRMRSFYLWIFPFILIAFMLQIITWEGYLLQKIGTSIIGVAILLCIYVFISFKRKIDSYLK